MGNVVPYERPDIFTEGGACVLLIHSVDVRHVLVVPGLHRVIGADNVGSLWLVSVLVTVALYTRLSTIQPMPGNTLQVSGIFRGLHEHS